MKLDTIINKIPNYNRFFTVDELNQHSIELAEQYPDIAKMEIIGNSANGEPIYCVKIGDYPKNAFAYGFPHPNEPIGAMSMDCFCRLLVESKELRDHLGFTWHIVKCCDPDAVRLNEKWFSGPFNVYNISRNLYRPSANKQVEWTFPISYKNHSFNDPMPETVIIQNLIEKLKPEFVYSLHNAYLGGAYWYLSHPLNEESYEKIRNSVHGTGVPIKLGEPETPSTKLFSDGIYEYTGISGEYDYLEKQLGADNVSFCYGTNVVDCANANGVKNVFVSELPYFYCLDADNKSTSDTKHRDIAVKSCEIDEEISSFLKMMLEKYKDLFSKENKFIMAVQEKVNKAEKSLKAKRIWAESIDKNKLATVAQVFDNLYGIVGISINYLGMLLRAFEYEIEKTADSINNDCSYKINNGLENADQMLKKWCEYFEKNVDYSVIPIKNLVQIQLLSGIIAAKSTDNEIPYIN